VAEDAIELVEIALVLDQRGARQIVEVLDPAAGEVLLHRLHQREIFTQRHRHTGRFQLVEEANKHQRRGPGRLLPKSSMNSSMNFLYSLDTHLTTLSLASRQYSQNW
jgi:hypothetical protein